MSYTSSVPQRYRLFTKLRQSAGQSKNGVSSYGSPVRLKLNVHGNDESTLEHVDGIYPGVGVVVPDSEPSWAFVISADIRREA